MHKTILLPTDFSVASLHGVKCVIDKHRGECLEIVFVTGVLLSENMMDLLFFSKKKLIKNLSEPDFKEACEIIRNRYVTEVKAIRFEIFTGFTRNAFTRFLEANSIDEVYVPENALDFDERLFDPIPFMEAAKLPVHRIVWDDTSFVKGTNSLTRLFTNWN